MIATNLFDGSVAADALRDCLAAELDRARWLDPLVDELLLAQDATGLMSCIEAEVPVWSGGPRSDGVSESEQLSLQSRAGRVLFGDPGNSIPAAPDEIAMAWLECIAARSDALLRDCWRQLFMTGHLDDDATVRWAGRFRDVGLIITSGHHKEAYSPLGMALHLGRFDVAAVLIDGLEEPLTAIPLHRQRSLHFVLDVLGLVPVDSIPETVDFLRSRMGPHEWLAEMTRARDVTLTRINRGELSLREIATLALVSDEFAVPWRELSTLHVRRSRQDTDERRLPFVHSLAAAYIDCPATSELLSRTMARFLEAVPEAVSARDGRLLTPLHHAVEDGTLQSVATLLSHGADPLDRATPGGRAGLKTPLHLARGDRETLALLQAWMARDGARKALEAAATNSSASLSP